MRYSVYIFLLLFLLYGCSSSNVREQYGLKLKEFPIDCDSLIKSIEVDRLGDTEFSSEVTQVDENIVKVHIRFDLKDTVKQDDWQVRIKPAFKPEFNWAPHLTPTVNNIIDQHVFRSPALIATDQQRGIVIIPDLDILSRSGKNRWYMDMDAENNILSLGMSASKVSDHVLYERQPGAVYELSLIHILSW